MDFYIIGDRELVLAFRMAGIEGKTAENRSDVLEAFLHITGQGFSQKGQNLLIPVDKVPRVLILTEKAAAFIEEEEIAWQKTGKYPLIVEIPSLSGPVEGKKSLSDAIRESIGVQV